MPDERLRPFCNTDRQWEILCAVETAGGNSAAAARTLNVARGTVTTTIGAIKRRAARNGYSPEHDMIRTVPDGFTVKGVSTLYGKDGAMAAQWVKSSIDAKRQEEIFREAVAAMTESLPRLAPSNGPEHTADHLMACYPVGDHHLGMLSWGEETGADYDLEISERLLMGAIDNLIDTVQPCDQAVIPFLGDLLHYDSFEAVTPTNKNLLDSDTRFPKLVRAAVRLIRYTIAATLRRHKSVLVIIEPGNHDPASSAFLMACLSAIYENEPRVTVDTSPRHYHYFRFGKCLVGTHHGHGAKMDKLPLIMATDRPEDWGQTTFRYWWTGHIHHDSAKDIEGCRVESFRILAPTDAWAANKGYRSGRDMKAIVLHRDFGEVARHIVNPAMLEKVA